MTLRSRSIAAAAGLLCLAVPFIAMAVMIAGGANRMAQTEYILPITGYDPRDLLRGHYLVFNYDWQPQAQMCQDASKPCCVCINGVPKFPYVVTAPCDDVVVGSRCKGIIPVDKAGDVFTAPAHLRRFYIPEQHAPALDQLIRAEPKRFSVGLALQEDGSGQIKQLYIDGRPFDEFLAARAPPSQQ